MKRKRFGQKFTFLCFGAVRGSNLEKSVPPIVQVVVVKVEMDVVVVVVEPLPPNVIVPRTHATAGFTALDSSIILSTSVPLYKVI